MDQMQLKDWLVQEDFQYRLKAIAALKGYPTDVAVPYLLQAIEDPEFLVRTFVVMGLGHHQTSETFAALLQFLKFDNTPSVRAEAANSLSLFGPVAAPHLVAAFEQDSHWLLRQSILAALCDLVCWPELYDVCIKGIQVEERTIQESAIRALGLFTEAPQRELVLSQLLELSHSAQPHIRKCVAQVLRAYSDEQAMQALERLRQDPDLQVVAATWPSPYPTSPNLL
jgi:HEAT repeat protein